MVLARLRGTFNHHISCPVIGVLKLSKNSNTLKPLHVTCLPKQQEFIENDFI
jgi:hypothetical protein